jgi:hypothetical protein
MESELSLAYFAGLIDGEGYLGIKRDGIKGRGLSPVYIERLSVGNTDKPILEMLMEYFSCGRLYYRRSVSSRNEWWLWDVVNRQAVSVLKQIYPYLRIKKIQAELIFALSESKMPQRFRLTPETIAYRDSLVDKIKSLHHPSRPIL